MKSWKVKCEDKQILLFTIVAKGRTLELEAPTLICKQLWKHMFETLIIETKINTYL